MAVTWNVNPVSTNVATDIFLMVMLVVWVKLMGTVSALGTMKNLRLGSRVYSFEIVGTLPHFRFGLSKFLTLKAQKRMDKAELRHWRIRNLIAFTTLGFSFVLIFVHVLIDYGLDFAFQAQESEVTSTYEMIEFRPSPYFVRNMSAIENFQEELRTCFGVEASSLECLERADAVQELLQANLQESMSFARMLYEAASVAQVDIFETIEFEYIPLDAENVTQRRKDCCIQEQKNIFDFDGTVLFGDGTPPCVLLGVIARFMELDMRAKKVATTKPIGGGLGDEIMLGGVSVRSSVDLISYEKFKDVSQLPSSMRTEQIESVGVLREFSKLFQLTVDSKVRYVGSGSQKLRLVDLTRRHFGVPQDANFALAEKTVSMEVGGDSDCAAPEREKEGGKSLDLAVQVESSGVVCSYTIKSVLDNCGTLSTPYAQSIEGDETRNRTIGYQRVEGLVLVEDGDLCGEEAKKHYAKQLTQGLEPDRLGLVLGFQFEIACTRQVEGGSGVTCIYGPRTVFFNGSSFQAERPEDAQGFRAKRIRLRSAVSWGAFEIDGGDPIAIREVKKNVGEIFASHYPTLRVVSNRGVMRGLLMGAKLSLSLRDVVAALSSQIARVDREVALTEQVEVTELSVPYFVGLGIVIGFNLIAGIFVGFRSLQENQRYKSLSLEVKIPTTLTGWIQTALLSKHRLRRENLDQALTYECRRANPSGRDRANHAGARRTAYVHFEENGGS